MDVSDVTVKVCECGCRDFLLLTDGTAMCRSCGNTDPVAMTDAPMSDVMQDGTVEQGRFDSPEMIERIKQAITAIPNEDLAVTITVGHRGQSVVFVDEQVQEMNHTQVEQLMRAAFGTFNAMLSDDG